jgi:hypothetical protein
LRDSGRADEGDEMTKRGWTLAVAAVALAPHGAAAQQGHKWFLPHGYDPHGPEHHEHEFAGPKLTTTLELGLRLDRTYSATNPEAKRYQAFLEHTEAELDLQLFKNFSIESTVKLEQVRDRGGDQFFDDHAAWIEQLFASYRHHGLDLFAGKFNPRFGIAWHFAPGVYGREFAEDYELTERIGFGAAYTLDRPDLGEHRLSVSTFFVDTSALSNSAFTRPEFGDAATERAKRFRKAQGGASNTKDLSSYAVVLEGAAIPFVEGFTYHLGYSDQRAGIDGADRERGYVAAATYRVDLGRAVAFYPLVEWVRFRNFGGNPAETDEDTGETTNPKADRDYLTVSGQVVYAPADAGTWNAALSYTRRNIEIDGASQPRDSLLQVSAGYRFRFGLGVDVGWARVKEEAETNRSVGALITYYYEF